MYKPSFKGTVEPTVQNQTPSSGEPDFSPKAPPEIKLSEKRQSGRFSRYFIQHKSDRIIYEVSLKTYEELLKQSERYDFRLYNLAKLEWDATLPGEDTYYGKYKREGSNTRNMREVNLVEEKMSGLRDYLKPVERLF